MSLFTDDTDLIDKIQKIIGRYPNIAAMMKKKDWPRWKAIVSTAGGFQAYWDTPERKLNMLIAAVMIYSNDVSTNDFMQHGVGLFEKLNKWLGCFPFLVRDPSFMGKIKDLDGVSFLSCMTELSLAAYLAEKGYTIQFEKKFLQHGKVNKNDVDVSATDSNGNTLNFDVYMPNYSSELTEFFDGHGQDHHFTYKVTEKLKGKFGNNGFSGLSGKTLLAVNYSFCDDVYARSVLPLMDNFSTFKGLQVSLPDGVDGIMYFADNFNRGTSLYLDTVIYAGEPVSKS
ncbi:hypothetical protein GCM10027049_02210 [Mucilaginibacter puniceus]